MKGDRRLPSVLAAVAVLQLLLSTASAGSESAPEIEDATGDSSLGADPFPSARAPEVDVLYAFFEERDNESFRAVLVVQDLAEGQDSCAECAWAVVWEWQGRTYSAYLLRNPASGAPFPAAGVPLTNFREKFALGLGNPATASRSFPLQEIAEISGAVEYGSPARLRFSVPYSALPSFGPGSSLENTRAIAYYVNESAAPEGVQGQGYKAWKLADRGPDRGFGLGFTIPGSARSAANETGNATTNATSAAQEAGDALDDLLNKTAQPAPATGESAQAGGNGLVGLATLFGGSGQGFVFLLVLGAVLAGTTYGVSRTTTLGKLLAAIRRVPKRFRGQPQAGRTELSRLARQSQIAFKDGKITQRGLRKVRHGIAKAETELGIAAPLAAASAGSGRAIGASTPARYRKLRELPSGAFGKAVVAEDAQLGRKVVIKQLHPQWRAEPRVRAAFLREARIAGQLDHPNIVVVHDVDDKNDSIIMEYVEGGNLEERLEKGPLPLMDALRITEDVLNGLERVHQESVFHRDLKPANILLTKDGRAKITDFGIAHAPGSSLTRFSATGHQPGTPLYMAPEQVKNESPDARTDLYAVAAMLHEMLTGNHYLGSKERQVFDLLRAIVDDAPTVDAAIPAGLQPVIRKGLAKKREERFQSAAEMRRAIQDARRSLGF